MSPVLLGNHRITFSNHPRILDCRSRLTVAERQQACHIGHYVVFRDNSQQNSRVRCYRKRNAIHLITAEAAAQRPPTRLKQGTLDFLIVRGQPSTLSAQSCALEQQSGTGLVEAQKDERAALVVGNVDGTVEAPAQRPTPASLPRDGLPDTNVARFPLQGLQEGELKSAGPMSTGSVSAGSVIISISPMSAGSG
jgi:hypothetical protein